ncbi:MAG: thioredoxin family protein [Proteobacteria bacterium]|nr:thioredoxin family protein [Pseudomonadota bacterium]
MFFNRQILFVLALIFLRLNSASAATSEWHKSSSDAAQTRLIASFYEEKGERKLIAGVQFKIGSGWKIYGEQSGGIGMPPAFVFSGSNYLNHHISWPSSEIFEEKVGDETFHYSAYHNEVIIPVKIDLQKNGELAELTLSLDYGACKNICIPVNEKFSLKIPNEIDEEILKEIEKFYPTKLTDESTPTTTSPQQTTKLPTLLTYIFFALLGGLILNVMPCVLPVLSIKLFSIIDRPSANISRVRFSFFATTLGILTCFLSLALLACLIKITGNELGWGLQFQNPQFLIVLIIITTFFTANLFGKFELTFEQALATFLNKKINEGEKKKNIFLPNFLSGILATLLATPCSAPFLGSAISFALVQDFTIISVIFFFIGIGFSAPYIVLFFAPKLVYSLPKPGIWMIKFKKILALLMAATLFWLLHVLSNNLGLTASILVALLSAGIFFSTKIPEKSLRYVILAVLICAIFSVSEGLKKYQKPEVQKFESLWQKFDEEEIQRQVGLGKTVLVDITADWCLTCKFNKIRVLQSKEISLLIKRGDIIALRGDITKPNPEIMAFMRKYNRFAIPFNAVYGPGAVNGLVASELLNQGELLKLIEQAK